MQAWTHLARLALIGTEHQQPAPSTVGDASLDELLAQLGPEEERENYLLKSGAVLALAQRSGYQPGHRTPSLSAAAPETQARCPEAAGQDLARMLGDYLPQVLPEWLELAGARSLRSPEEWLPALLDHARTKAPSREGVKAVLGQRGAWLAAQNDAWSFATSTGGDEKAWHEGRHAERIAALREIRQTRPARARELLSASWKEETAEDRAEFTQVLRQGLSLEDESFLEAALEDKRKEVRAVAARLLGSLPGSQLVRRMTEWTTPLFQMKKSLLRSPALEITLPAECTKEMSRYGIGTARFGNAEVGEKAGWLSEMLEAVPPSHWTATWGVEAKALILAAAKSDLSKAVLLGWSLAAAHHQDYDWIDAWLELAPAHEDLQACLGRLSSGDFSATRCRAKTIAGLLGMDGNQMAIGGILARIGEAPRPWSEEYARLLLNEAQPGLLKSSAVPGARYRWHQLLKAMALGIPVDLPQATTWWPKEIEDPNIREIVDEFCAVVEFRRGVHRHFNEEK